MYFPIFCFHYSSSLTWSQIIIILKTSIDNGKLKTYDEVFAEIQLIWDNCKTYNMAGSDIYKLAEYMEKLTKRQVQRFKSQMGLNIPNAPSSIMSKWLAIEKELKFKNVSKSAYFSFKMLVISERVLSILKTLYDIGWKLDANDLNRKAACERQ